MKIIEVARQQKDLLNEGIAYIAVWQQAVTGGKKSWFTEDFFPETTSEDEPVFSDEVKTRLKEIAAADPDAVLLNGYYHGQIGSVDEPMNAADISLGIKRHYEMHNFLVSEFLLDDEQRIEFSTEIAMEADPPIPFMPELQKQIDDLLLPRANADDLPGTITIELPTTNVNRDILISLIASRATLIRAALGDNGTGELPVRFDALEGKVLFEWLRSSTDADTVAAWSAFLAAVVRFSKTAKRVTAKDAPAENEKFAFRTFLVRLGMNDAENKAARKLLMRNLKGDSAFATPEGKERWLAKHGAKKTGEVAAV